MGRGREGGGGKEECTGDNGRGASSESLISLISLIRMSLIAALLGAGGIVVVTM